LHQKITQKGQKSRFFTPKITQKVHFLLQKVPILAQNRTKNHIFLLFFYPKMQ